MTQTALGALVLIWLIYLWWRDRPSIVVLLAAMLLGATAAWQGGPLDHGLHLAAQGIQAALNAASHAFGSGKGK